jgi:hypothetical protein
MTDTQSNRAFVVFRKDVAPSSSSALPVSSGWKEEAFPPPVRQVSFDNEVETIPNNGSLEKEEEPILDLRPPAVQPPIRLSMELSSFWFSHNAVKLFNPRFDETPEGAVDDILESLEKALDDKAFDGDFGQILQGGKDALQFLSEAELTKIAIKARHIFTALTFAKDTIDHFERFSFQDCCNRAIASLSFDVPTDERPKGVTVLRWFRQFKRSRTFELPVGKKELVAVRGAISVYFYRNPSMHSIFLHHMTRYLRTGIADTLACVAAYKYFKETLLPFGAREEGYTDCSFGLFIANHRLSKLNQRTFEAWFRDVLAEHRPTALASF